MTVNRALLMQRMRKAVAVRGGDFNHKSGARCVVEAVGLKERRFVLALKRPPLKSIPRLDQGRRQSQTGSGTGTIGQPQQAKQDRLSKVC